MLRKYCRHHPRAYYIRKLKHEEYVIVPSHSQQVWEPRSEPGNLAAENILGTTARRRALGWAPRGPKWYFSAIQLKGRTADDGAGLQKQKEFQHTGVMEKYDWKRDG